MFWEEDDYLGSVVLESSRFCPQGFEGELRLTGAGQGGLAWPNTTPLRVVGEDDGFEWNGCSWSFCVTFPQKMV